LRCHFGDARRKPIVFGRDTEPVAPGFEERRAANGIEWILRSIAQSAWQSRLDPRVYLLARKLTDHEARREDKMRALVDELHRQSAIARRYETTDVALGAMASLDADDACVFVAAAAMSVGIPCRFVGVRYGHSWTCWLQYEAGLIWEMIDPLRQKTDREPDEQVIGPNPKE
jgi:hypothetical protein